MAEPLEQELSQLVAGERLFFRDASAPMLTVLGGLAEFERDLVRARISEGRERARAPGVRMGRPPKLTPHQRREVLQPRNRGTETLADMPRSYAVGPATISRRGP